MIELQLRDEFKGKKLKGTTVDFTNQSQTARCSRTLKTFLRITYPSFDLLKTIEATSPGQSRPLALIGSRGQGKSHLMAALFHLCMNPVEGREWLDQWSHTLGDPKLKQLHCAPIVMSLQKHASAAVSVSLGMYSSITIPKAKCIGAFGTTLATTKRMSPVTTS